MKEAYDKFKASPCYQCDMISLMHAHSEEAAKNFKFGCSGEKLDACRRLRGLYLSGPPGALGCARSDRDCEKCKYERECREYDPEKERQEYRAQIAECQRILGDADKTIW